MTDALFAEFPVVRRREAASLAAHYVAGVLDRDAVLSGLVALLDAADFQSGDRVRTLKGSVRGTVRALLKDGRVEWLPDGASNALIALPEALLKEQKR